MTDKDSANNVTAGRHRATRQRGTEAHVFTGGSKPTGLRYCSNSASFDFEPGAAH